MIGYKVNVGYVFADNPYNLTDLSDINFLDYERAYTIPVSLTGDRITTENNIPLNDLFSKMSTRFSESDLLEIYGVRAYSGNGYNIEAMRDFFNQFPSIQRMYNNTNEFLNSLEQKQQFVYVYHLIGLNRLIAGYGNSPCIYKVDGTKLSQISIGLSGTGFFYGTYLNQTSALIGAAYSGFYLMSYDGPETIVSNIRYYTIIDYGSYGRILEGSLDARLAAALFGEATEPDYEFPTEPDDPYGPGGESGGGGGEGDFDDQSDDIDFPELPALSAVDTKFITLFNPSIGELQNLASYMWSNLFDIDTWKKIFADPMDAILGLSIVPVNVPSGGSGTITVGNISTGISMNKAASQYVTVDCGSLNVNEYWGAYLDYEPFTKSEIYLPYIGTHSISVDDIMNKNVHVKYNVDILTGACNAFVKCGNSVLYEFAGQCSTSIPITGNDWTNVINGYIQAIAGIGMMSVATGAGAPLLATSAVASTASYTVTSMKPTIQRSGKLTGMGGMLGIQKPYLILTRPRQALPANQNAFEGYPSFITLDLSSCSGFTQIYAIHLENIPATSGELNELEAILKDGVIF